MSIASDDLEDAVAFSVLAEGIQKKKEGVVWFFSYIFRRDPSVAAFTEVNETDPRVTAWKKTYPESDVAAITQEQTDGDPIVYYVEHKKKYIFSRNKKDVFKVEAQKTEDGSRVFSVKACQATIKIKNDLSNAKVAAVALAMEYLKDHPGETIRFHLKDDHADVKAMTEAVDYYFSKFSDNTQDGLRKKIEFTVAGAVVSKGVSEDGKAPKFKRFSDSSEPPEPSDPSAARLVPEPAPGGISRSNSVRSIW